MAKRKKPGQRTKSGRLSRAHKTVARDHGTPEAQAKRGMLVGENGDPNLSASAPGILHAHGYLDREQYAEALEYRRLRCILYGSPWPMHGVGPSAGDGRISAIRDRFDRKVRVLNELQRHVITNVAVFDFYPSWFFALRLGLKLLPEDYAEKAALLSGLDAMLGRSPARKVAA